jgi:SAM-dependent methyltransferase
MDLTANNWWKEAFGQIYLDAWKSIYSDARAKEESSFLFKELRLKKDAALLDAPCGWGRHSIEFSKFGLKVTGLDYSPVLLNAARKQARIEKVTTTFKKTDLRSFQSQEKFDAVVILGNSFGYFTDKENEKVIKNFSQVTKKGGSLVIDIANLAGMLQHRTKNGGQVIDIPRGKIFIRETEFDPCSLTSSLEWRITLHKKVSIIHGKLRFYTFPEIRRILFENNFIISEIFGSFDGTPYTMDSPRMIIFAQKR